MSCENDCGFSACGFLGVVLSVVSGAIIGILFAFGFIPFIIISTWIAFGLAVLFLIFLVSGVFLSATKKNHLISRCLCKNGICLLVGTIGTIGTIISALAALSIVLTAEFISVITLVAIGAFFFALMIIAFISLISCILCKLCVHREN